MRISTLPQIYRNFNRWREILAVLSKYELASWIGRLGPEFAKNLLKEPGGTAIARHPWKTRVRLALTELGPTFIKLGQILSTRPDLVGVDLAAELSHLQADVPADPPETVRRIIEQQFGRPVNELFAEFESQAFASASIGQVHRARLHGGQSVVVKVQHADIRAKVAVDLEILGGLAVLAERIPEFRNFRPRATVTEFGRVLSRELDFERELRNLQQFARDFAGDRYVQIPAAYPDLSTQLVLTMQRIDGVPVGEVAAHPEVAVDLGEVARRGAQLYLKMIFERGFYHADPHPGNVRVLPGGVVGLLDFGMVGRIDPQLMEDVGEMLVAIADLDSDRLANIITRVGACPPDLDRASLGLDVADFISYYAGQSLDRFDVSGALNEMIEIIWRYRIMLPARVAMLLKVLVTLEGTARLLNPKFNLLEVMGPYRRKLLLRRLSPRRRWQKLRRLYADLEHLLTIVPGGLRDILEQVQSGRFDVHLDHRGLEPSVNRLVLGMLASAMFLGSSLLLSRGLPPTIYGVSVVGALGSLFSMAMGARLWLAISKSGHLDRRD